MKSERVELPQIGRRQALNGRAGVVFVEGVVRTLHAAVEEVAGVGVLAVIGDLGRAVIEREVRRRRGCPALEQSYSGAREAIEVEDVGRRTVGHATHRVRQLVQGDADQQVRVDIGGEIRAGVVGCRVVCADHAPELQLRVPDRDVRLPLDRGAGRQAVEGRVADARVVDQHRAGPRVVLIEAIVGACGGAATGPAIVDVDIDGDLVVDVGRQDRDRLLQAVLEARRRCLGRGVENEVDRDAASGDRYDRTGRRSTRPGAARAGGDVASRDVVARDCIEGVIGKQIVRR